MTDLITLGSSFNHLVGARGEPRRHFKAKHLCGLKVDHKLKFSSLIDRQLGGLLALKDPSDVASGTALAITNIGSIAHQTASGCGGTGFICRRDRDLRSERH